MNKSMKKRVDFWMDLLLDFGKVFWRVFGRVLGGLLALKIDGTSIKKMNKILIDFLMGF